VKPGDLVKFTHHTGIPFQSNTQMGILLSFRITKWDKKITFYKFITPDGVTEVILGTEGTSWEIIR
jgi:hypothetical protein